MFPNLDRANILKYRMWRSAYAQPVTKRRNSTYVPGCTTPFENMFISTMAQVYPADRGTNYAIREGQKVPDTIAIGARR
jgi:predicted membrane metal-binding protein